jgi:hypothetical protein
LREDVVGGSEDSEAWVESLCMRGARSGLLLSRSRFGSERRKVTVSTFWAAEGAKPRGWTHRPQSIPPLQIQIHYAKQFHGQVV